MSKFTAYVAAAVLLASADIARAQTAPADLSVYGALPAFDLPVLSPSGDRLAYVAVAGEDRSLIINDLSDMSLIGGVRAGDIKVRDLDWIGEDYVMVTTSATQASNLTGNQRSELFEGQIYSLATRRVARALGPVEGVFPRLAGSPIIRNVDGGMLIAPASGYKGMGLYHINLATGGSLRTVQEQQRAGGYVFDADARPVSRVAYDGRTYEWELQAYVNGFWRTVWSVRAPIDTPGVVGLGVSARELVVMGGEGAKSDEYRLFNLDTRQWSDLPFEGKIDSPIFHPRTRLLIGAATETDDGRDYEFLDTDAQRAWRSVTAAFRTKRVRFVSWSEDMRQIVVLTEGDGDPGTYQLVDMERRLAEVIGALYPLTPEQVGEIRPVEYPAADGMAIPGYLTLPPGVTDPQNLPLVVLPHGGPASRDYMGFDWWAQAIASRGYAVLQPNFRGSDGLGVAHLEAGYGEWGRKMQTDLSDGVRWLASKGWVDPSKVCIVGASYGGYAAMAGPTLDVGVYRCAVSVAGVSDLRAMVQWSSAQSGARDAPAVRYWNRFMGAERLGDRDLDAISPAKLAARSDAPILLLHGRDDTVVPFVQSKTLADALRAAGKPYELIELSGEDHWLSRAETRTRMLAETVRFLESHNPPR
jgi:dipeptidyl aminopeptidase/acylaminoacyl peptidase